MEPKNMNNIITVFAIAAVAIAVINLSVTFMKVSDFKEEMTGYVSGYVNISIQTSIAINLTQNQVNFSNGQVDNLATHAYAWTNGAEAATIVDGNWSTTAEPLIVMNAGNINCSVNITSAHNNTELLGNTTVVPAEYQFNVTDKEEGSCTQEDSAEFGLTAFTDLNTTTLKVCGQFSSLTGSNEIYIDINMTIPVDGVTGTLADTITISADTAG